MKYHIMRNIQPRRVISRIQWLILSLLYLPLVSSCFAQSSINSPQVLEETFWYDGNIKKSLWFTINRVAIIPDKTGSEDIEALAEILRKKVPGASAVIELENRIIYLGIPEIKNVDGLTETVQKLNQLPNIKNISPLFFQDSKQTRDWQLLSGELIIHFKSEWTEPEISRWFVDKNLSVIEQFSFARNAYRVIQVDNARTSLDMANELYESGDVKFSYPNWIRNRSARESRGPRR